MQVKNILIVGVSVTVPVCKTSQQTRSNITIPIKQAKKPTPPTVVLFFVTVFVVVAFGTRGHLHAAFRPSEPYKLEQVKAAVAVSVLVPLEDETSIVAKSRVMEAVSELLGSCLLATLIGVGIGAGVTEGGRGVPSQVKAVDVLGDLSACLVEGLWEELRRCYAVAVAVMVSTVFVTVTVPVISVETVIVVSGTVLYSVLRMKKSVSAMYSEDTRCGADTSSRWPWQPSQ